MRSGRRRAVVRDRRPDAARSRLSKGADGLRRHLRRPQQPRHAAEQRPRLVEGRSAVLASDGFDVWKLPRERRHAVNLTVDGKKSQTRYQRSVISRRAGRGGAGGGRGGRGGGGAAATASIFAAVLYFATYGEWTKKAGIGRRSIRQAGRAAALVFEDASSTSRRRRTPTSTSTRSRRRSSIRTTT